jgi:drug/metabolite transporter (DMT)-like permease
MPKSKTKNIALSAFIALIVAEILWGVNKPIIKLGLETIPVPIFLAVTVLGTALLILPFALRDWKKLALRDYLILIIGSIISITIGNVALLMGLERVPAVNASLISLFSPLLLLFFSIHFLKERLSVRALLGILVAFVGGAVIIGKPWEITSMNDGLAIGNMFLILSVLCDIVGTLVTKTVLKRGGLYQVTFIHLFAGILPVAVFSVHYISALSPANAQTSGYIAIAVNILLITFANALFMYGLKHKKAQEVGVFTYVSPVATIIAAWLILNERLDWKTAVGAGLIFLGVYLVSAKSKFKVRHARR